MRVLKALAMPIVALFLTILFVPFAYLAILFGKWEIKKREDV